MRYLSIIALCAAAVMSSGAALAQHSGTKSEQSACSRDAQRFCRKGLGNVHRFHQHQRLAGGKGRHCLTESVDAAMRQHGEGDGVGLASRTDHSATKFTASYQRRLISKVGHNVPQEAPRETVAAIRDLMKGTEP